VGNSQEYSPSKNIYGVLPPITEDAQNVESVLFMDERYWWADQVFTLDDGKKFSVGRYDGAVKLNSLEQAFARALDEADFVHWWHRNPDKKGPVRNSVCGARIHS